MNVFPSFSLDYIMGLEWESFYYWYRRASEIKNGALIGEDADSAKIDEQAFLKSEEYLNKRLAEIEKSKEGTISG